MGLFDIFKKKETVKSTNPNIEDVKLTDNRKEDTSAKVRTQETYSGENTYQFKGINQKFLNQLYYIDETQKERLIKFLEKMIVKFSLNEIKTQKSFEDFFFEGYEKIDDFIENYPDKYEDNNTYLSFPYFSIREFFLFETHLSLITKINGKIESEKLNIDEPRDVGFIVDVCIFNIENKGHNGLIDINKEEKEISDWLSKEDKYRYYIISPVFTCLIKHYLKINNFQKVNELIEEYVKKTDSEDYHNLEITFQVVASEFSKINESEKEREYLNKGIDFLKTYCPIPKTKTTGNTYKSLIEFYCKENNYLKASEIIEEAISYNGNLAIKQLKARIEKQLNK
jgi:pentatricopeptide repeat protein